MVFYTKGNTSIRTSGGDFIASIIIGRMCYLFHFTLILILISGEVVMMFSMWSVARKHPCTFSYREKFFAERRRPARERLWYKSIMSSW